MRIEEHPDYSIMLYADDVREQGLLGQLVMNVRTHGYWAADLLEGEITILPFTFPPRGELTVYPPDPICTAEIAGFKRRRPDPVPIPEPSPDTEWINGVEVSSWE